MRILVTGGTGEIGRRSVSAMLERGHTVHMTTRTADNDRAAELSGATPIRVDLFDADAVSSAARGVDSIVHLATKIPPTAQMSNLSAWVVNDRLRDETTKHLVDAALAHDIQTLVVQTYFAVTPPKDDRWIDADPGALFASDEWSGIGVMESARAAERYIVRLAQAGGNAVALRCGSIYSETSEQLQAQVDSLRAGTAAIPDPGDNYWPFLASDDAGRACAAAVELPTGIYHVAENEPVRLREFWSCAAAAVGVDVPPVTTAEGPFAQILLGSWRTSNSQFCRASGWAPTRSVLDGWPDAAERYLETGAGVRPSPPAQRQAEDAGPRSVVDGRASPIMLQSTCTNELEDP